MPKRSANIACISEFDMFEVEYWSLEQAKLGKSNEKSLARQVAVITGGGSGIGAATARAMAKEGAEVAILDRDLDAAKAVAKKIGGKALAVECDVTDPPSIRAAFDAGGFGLWRRGYRGVQCRRGLAGHHRPGRRRNPAQVASS